MENRVGHVVIETGKIYQIQEEFRCSETMCGKIQLILSQQARFFLLLPR